MQKPFQKKNSFGTNLCVPCFARKAQQTYNKFSICQPIKSLPPKGEKVTVAPKPRFVINQSSFFLINCSIFYFLPFWAVAFPINFFSHFYSSYITALTSLPSLSKKGDKVICFFLSSNTLKGVRGKTQKGEKGDVSSNLFKPSIFFSNYRQKLKSSITNNCKQLDNIQFITILFPFVLSFSLLIRSRYKEHFFSYFVNETLPGFCLPYQNISWETFNEITSKKIVYTQNSEQSLTPFFCDEHITDIETSLPLQSKSFSVLEAKSQKGDQVICDDVSNLSMLEGYVDEEPSFITLTSRDQQNNLPTPNKGLLHNKSGVETKKVINNTNLDLIERLDIYSNLIILEMKPVWEEQQKQLYIGFLPKKKEIALKKLPLFSHSYKAKKGPFAFSDFTNPLFFTQKQNVIHSKETNLLFVKGSGFAHQTKNNKLATSSPFKLYARKPSFLSFSKFKVSLKKKSIDQRFKVKNIFSKQYLQQKFVNLDELPLKLDQNYSINCDQTSLLNTLFNYNAKQNYVNLSNVKEVKETFSLFSDYGVTSGHPFRDVKKAMSAINNQKKDQQFFASNTLKGVKGSDVIDLILPFKSEGSSRLLSGYRFPDTERMQLNSLFIQNLYKNILFQKANLLFSFLNRTSGYVRKDQQNLKIIIQVPSSFVYDFLNENNSFLKNQQKLKNILTDKNLWYAPNSDLATNITLSPFKGSDVRAMMLKGNVSDVSDGKIVERKNLLTNPQLNFHYLPVSETFLNKVLAEKSNIGGIYQKVFTTYKADQTTTSLFTGLTNQRVGKLTSSTDILLKNVNDVKRGFLTPLLAMSNKNTIVGAQSFRESWEPVTLQSWLAITKLSFAFFVLKFLQYFYNNYGRDLLIIVLRFLDENLKEKLGLSTKKKNKGYRLIKKVKKAFKDVAGIDNILPELGEMVWVLRNSGKGATTFKFGNLLPKGFLFVGPPGTGKTFLVQAIAGEAGVPVLVQSGSSLTDAGENEKGAQRLKSMFEKARQLAPCIVFIDEIDTLGETRQNVMRTPDAQQGVDDLIQSLQKYNQSSNTTYSGTQSKEGDVFASFLPSEGPPKGMSELQPFKLSTNKSGNKAEKSDRSNINNSENLQNTQKNGEKQKSNQEQLTLLMQLLIELDGLKSRKGVLVIGATNRPKVLDPALTRPGRFDRVLNLEFPGKKKRIEILKLYSQNIGLPLPSASFSTSPSGVLPFTPSRLLETISKSGSLLSTDQKKKQTSYKDVKMSDKDYLTSPNNIEISPKVAEATFFEKKRWEYLANRTFGFSAADLAAAMNQSSIQAILQKTGHTIETIEQGIEFITSYSIEKLKIESETNQETFCCLTSDTSNTLPLLLWGPSRSNKNVVFVNPKEIRFFLRTQKGGYFLSTNNSSDVKKETLKGVLGAGTKEAVLEANINPYKSKSSQSFMSDIGSTVNEKQKGNSKTTFFAPSFVEQEDGKQKLAKENKTILQIPSLIINVKLPKALLSFAPNTSFSSFLLGQSRSVNQNKEKKDPFFITRFAYYQAGKAVLHTLLPEHPDAIILKLWPQPKNSRHKDANFQLTSIDHRAKLETRLIGLYAGKAAELLFLCLNSHIKKENLLLSLLRTEKIGKLKKKVKNLTSRHHLSLPLQGQKNKEMSEKIDFSLYEKRNLCHSNLGIDELSIASNLANSLVDKWFFYSNKTTLRKENQIFTNQNILEFSKIEVVDLFQQLTEEAQNLVSASNISESSMLTPKGAGREKHCRSNFQEWSIRPWWQNQITKETGNLKMFYDDWYRIYLPNSEESERSEESVIPDQYYHNTQNLKNLLPFFGRKQSNQGHFDYAPLPNTLNIETSPSNITDIETSHSQEKRKKQKNLVFKNDQTQNSLYFDITWNDLYKIDRDYIYQALILTCFNKAFSLLDNNRELLDYLADYLMRFETLRQHKIEEIFCDFGNLTSNLLKDVRSNVTQVNFYKVENNSFSKNILKEKEKNLPFGRSKPFRGVRSKPSKKFVFDKKWGINSRRNFSNFFNFDSLITPVVFRRKEGYLASKFANFFQKDLID